MRRRFLLRVLLLLLTVYLLRFGSSIPLVYGNATIPTRTPTPVPTEPGGGNDNPPPPPPPPATDIPATEPPATPTAEPFTPAPTPEGGFFPTAAPCAENPTVFANLGTTNVRQGPGVEYDAINQLVFLEVRQIIGRTANAPWWLITLEDGSSGWVADNAVSANGNLLLVPIVDPPALDGVVPTPGAPFNPGINSGCPPPTTTSVPTDTPVAESTPAAAESEAVVAATATPAPSETALPSATPVQSTPTAVPLGTSPAADIISTPLPTAVPLPDDATADGNGIGIYFLATAIFLLIATALFIRRRGKPDS